MPQEMAKTAFTLTTVAAIVRFKENLLHILIIVKQTNSNSKKKE